MVKFSKWESRSKLSISKFPGVYIIAYKDNYDISSNKFDWDEDIIYIGMTNSKGVCFDLPS
jgi:hypothetical protein